MIDGGRTCALVANVEVCLYEAMRDLAGQFSNGGMTIDEFLDVMEQLTSDAARKEDDYAHT